MVSRLSVLSMNIGLFVFIFLLVALNLFELIGSGLLVYFIFASPFFSVFGILAGIKARSRNDQGLNRNRLFANVGIILNILYVIIYLGSWMFLFGI